MNAIKTLHKERIHLETLENKCFPLSIALEVFKKRSSMRYFLSKKSCNVHLRKNRNVGELFTMLS